MDRQERVRDHMDDIFEAKNFFRKHVAKEPESIFRAVADVLFTTQRYRGNVKDAVAGFATTKEGIRLFDEDYMAEHKEARALSKIFSLSIEIVSSTDPRMQAFVITPNDAYYAPFIQDDNESDYGSESNVSLNSSLISNSNSERSASQDDRVLTKILLCFTEPNQYDPIYHSSMIEAAGIAQSILYELLYEKVFHQEDAYEASKIMLSDDPYKPTVYDKDFKGKPMEAINNCLVPFPYKVAKAMDPFSYRNIEYDVWISERKSITTSPRQKSSQTSPSSTSSSPRANGSPLLKGSPCYVSFAQKCIQPGFIQGPTSNGRLIEVFIPCHDFCIFVKRKDILPLKNPPEEFNYLRRTPNENSRKFPPLDLQFPENEADEADASTTDGATAATAEVRVQNDLTIFETQIRNHSLTMYDKNWLKKFDFTIPPPNVSSSAPTTPVRTTFPPVTPLCCAPSSSGPPDLGSPFASPVYYQPEDPTFYQTDAANNSGNFVQNTDPSFVQTNDPNFAQMNNGMSYLQLNDNPNFAQVNNGQNCVQLQDPKFVQPEVCQDAPDSGIAACTIPGCSCRNPGQVPMDGASMQVNNPQDAGNYAGMTSSPQMVPVSVATAIPSSPNPALEGSYVWLPIMVSPNPWSRSAALPGTPIPTPNFVGSSTTFFRFDAPYVQDFAATATTPVLSPYLGSAQQQQQPVFTFPPTIPNQQQPGYQQQQS